MMDCLKQNDRDYFQNKKKINTFFHAVHAIDTNQFCSKS